MQLIQFISILNLNQMKLVKVMQMIGNEKQSEFELADESKLDARPLRTCDKQLMAG
jgi:hypothetical protein